MYFIPTIHVKLHNNLLDLSIRGQLGVRLRMMTGHIEDLWATRRHKSSLKLTYETVSFTIYIFIKVIGQKRLQLQRIYNEICNKIKGFGGLWVIAFLHKMYHIRYFSFCREHYIAHDATNAYL